jgi:uncharacterized membrane protein YdjX (TVP38/TMEM64 family)
MNGRLIFKIIISFLFIALAIYFSIHFDFYIYFINKHRAIKFINSFHPYDNVVFILLQILQVVFAPIPGEITGFIGGYLYGPVWGTIYSSIGLSIGSWIAFALARFLGLPMVEKVVNPLVMQKFDYFLEHRGLFVSFFLFLIPGFPKDVLCYIIGLSHMKMWHFLAISTIGRLLGVTLLSVSGHSARNDQYTMFLLVAGISAVFIIAAYFYRDKWFERLKRKQ